MVSQIAATRPFPRGSRAHGPAKVRFYDTLHSFGMIDGHDIEALALPIEALETLQVRTVTGPAPYSDLGTGRGCVFGPIGAIFGR